MCIDFLLLLFVAKLYSRSLYFILIRVKAVWIFKEYFLWYKLFWNWNSAFDMLLKKKTGLFPPTFVLQMGKSEHTTYEK